MENLLLASTLGEYAKAVMLFPFSAIRILSSIILAILESDCCSAASKACLYVAADSSKRYLLLRLSPLFRSPSACCAKESTLPKRRYAAKIVYIENFVPFIISKSFSAYKFNKLLLKKPIKRGCFFIYKKKSVNLCPILRSVCHIASLRPRKAETNIIKTINYYAK